MVAPTLLVLDPARLVDNLKLLCDAAMSLMAWVTNWIRAVGMVDTRAGCNMHDLLAIGHLAPKLLWRAGYQRQHRPRNKPDAPVRVHVTHQEIRNLSILANHTIHGGFAAESLALLRDARHQRKFRPRFLANMRQARWCGPTTWHDWSVNTNSVLRTIPREALLSNSKLLVYIFRTFSVTRIQNYFRTA
jgi:hypothetical protein